MILKVLQYLQRLCPTYGNWGGPGWSGGEWQDDSSLTRWDVQPIDELDALFRAHDMAYQSEIYSHKSSDNMLVHQLISCPVKGWYANVYRTVCIIVFFIRSLGSDGLGK